MKGIAFRDFETCISYIQDQNDLFRRFLSINNRQEKIIDHDVFIYVP